MSLVRWRRPSALRPWDPFREMEEHMRRVFQDFALDTWENGGEWLPAADFRETKDAYILEADLPGMKREDIEITVIDDVVTVRGERKDERKTETKGYSRYERHYGSFQRSFRVPGGVDGDKVKAEYKDGVLQVTIPKREEAKPKQIEVKVS